MKNNLKARAYRWTGCKGCYAKEPSQPDWRRTAGRIAESGTHEQLLAKGGIYEKLYHMH